MKNSGQMNVRKINMKNLEEIKNINNEKIDDNYSQLEQGIDICAHCGSLKSKVIEKVSPIDESRTIKAIKCFHCGASTKNFDTAEVDDVDTIVKKAWENKIDISLTNLNSTTELVPCPKCGSDEIHTVITFNEENEEEFFKKACKKCHYGGPIGRRSTNTHSEENLIKLWNTRTLCYEKMIPVSWMNGKFVKLNSKYNNRIVMLNALEEADFKVDDKNTIGYFKQYLPTERITNRSHRTSVTKHSLMCEISLNFPIEGIRIAFYDTEESLTDYILEFSKNNNLQKTFKVHSSDTNFNKDMTELVRVFFNKLYSNNNNLDSFFRELKAGSRNILTDL